MGNKQENGKSEQTDQYCEQCSSVTKKHCNTLFYAARVGH